MTESPLDAAPPDDLARAFELPSWALEDEGLSTLYDNVVARLRREAAGIPMQTVQTLLLERIAFFYIAMKYREADITRFTAAQQKDMNTYWLAMTSEFMKLLMSNQDKLREALLAEVQKIVVGGLKMVTDSDQQRTLRRYYSEKFAAIDL